MNASSAHYLDHAATTPLREGALEAWVRTQRLLAARPGNASSLHAGGRGAKRLLEDARARVAELLGVARHDVVFTSGATESDALGVVGAARGVRARDPRRRRVLLSSLEHPAVAEQAEVLRAWGFTVDLLASDAHGRTELDPLSDADLLAGTALVSICAVNSEIGTLQPLGGAVDALEGSGALLHTDAAQLLQVRPVPRADLVSVAGHKIGAPVGVGVLVVPPRVTVLTDRPGGGQERSVRSGTQDVAGAVAFAEALAECVQEREVLASHASALRERLCAGLPPRVRPTVPEEASVPTIVHLTLPTRHPEVLLLAMDRAGVMVSAGSACHAGVARPSQALLALGRGELESMGTLRVSTSLTTTKEDVDAFLAALPGALEAANALDAREGERGGGR